MNMLLIADVACYFVVLKPEVEIEVSLSINLLFLMSTNKSNCLRRSDPMMGVLTSVMMKSHEIGRRRPKFNFIVLLPNVFIGVPFAANKGNWVAEL